MSDRKPTNNPFEGDHAKAFEAVAAASALGITVATQAVGFWLSMMSGASAAMRKGADEAAPAEKQQAAPKAEAPKVEALKAEAPRKSAEIVELKPAVRRAKEKPAVKAKAEVAKPTEAKAELPKVVAPDDFRRPAAQDKPAQPDDLKQIKGVGPKLEVTLNGLGIWTLSQIAALEAAEIAWLDDYLGLSGRITRDGWVETARTAGKTKTTDEAAKAGGDNG